LPKLFYIDLLSERFKKKIWPMDKLRPTDKSLRPQASVCLNLSVGECFFKTHLLNSEHYGKKQEQAYSHAHEAAPKAQGARQTPQSHAEAAKSGCTQKLSFVAPTSSGLFCW
jgi:hypothetical protein